MCAAGPPKAAQIAHATVQVELDGDCISTSHENPLFCGEAALTEKKK